MEADPDYLHKTYHKNSKINKEKITFFASIDRTLKLNSPL